MKLLKNNLTMLVFILLIAAFAAFDIFLFGTGDICSQIPYTAGSSKPMKLAEGWQFKWDGSGYGTPFSLHFLSEGAEDGWKEFSIPWAAYNLNNCHSAWLRVTLPSGNWQQPSLLFRTYEQSVLLYINNELVYQYGNNESDKKSFSLKAPWHLVSLPSGFENSKAYFKIYSPSTVYAGDREDVIIGSGSDLAAYLQEYDTNTIRQRFDSILLSFLFVFIGFILILIYFFRKSEGEIAFSLGFFSLCIGTWIFTECNAKYIFIDAPVFWLYVGYISCHMIPLGLCSFVIKVFGDTEKRLVSKFKTSFIFLMIANLFMDLTNILPWSVSIRLFHLLLVAFIVVIVHFTFKAAGKGNLEAQTLALSFAVLSLFGIYDMVDRFYLPIQLLNGHHITQWAMFAFTLSLIFIAARRIFDGYDKLKIYSKEIEEKNDKLESMWLEVIKSRDQIKEWNKGLEHIVMQKTFSIKNLLDNADQGFMTIGRDFMVQKDFSLECVNIFEEKIENRSFPSLICKGSEERKYMELILLKILDTENLSKQELYMSLLPSEAVVRGKNISLKYKIIENSEIHQQKVLMVIITDITEKRSLEDRLEHERKTLKMIVKAVTDRTDFIKCIEEYMSFCNSDIHNILNGDTSVEEKLQEGFRKIHTFKGTFAQNDMVDIVEQLNTAEERLLELQRPNGHISLEELKMFFEGPVMLKWLDSDMSVLKGILGDNFFDYKEALMIDKEKLLEIENKTKSLLTPSLCKDLLPSLKSLRMKPFRELFSPYPKFVVTLSDKLDKSIAPLRIEGGEMLVDPDMYSSFSRSLVHIFKNSADHGIEPPDERLECKKEEMGRISCRIGLKESNISVVISDDGRGIDVDKIRIKAIESNYIQEEALSELSDIAILNLVFEDGFTTRTYSNNISGRGIGLSAVKREVEKIGGSVHIKSKTGSGTEFHFLLPAHDLTV